MPPALARRGSHRREAHIAVCRSGTREHLAILSLCPLMRARGRDRDPGSSGASCAGCSNASKASLNHRRRQCPADVRLSIAAAEPAPRLQDEPRHHSRASKLFACRRPAKVEQWRTRLGSAVRPRIGLVWSGNPKNRHRCSSQHRARRLDRASADRVRIFQAADPRARSRSGGARFQSASILSFDDALLDFENTAALCACLDVVITVDTSLAHLAGALGIGPGCCWRILPTFAGCATARTAPGIRASSYIARRRPAIGPQYSNASPPTCSENFDWLTAATHAEWLFLLRAAK